MKIKGKKELYSKHVKGTTVERFVNDFDKALPDTTVQVYEEFRARFSANNKKDMILDTVRVELRWSRPKHVKVFLNVKWNYGSSHKGVRLRVMYHDTIQKKLVTQKALTRTARFSQYDEQVKDKLVKHIEDALSKKIESLQNPDIIWFDFSNPDTPLQYNRSVYYNNMVDAARPMSLVNVHNDLSVSSKDMETPGRGVYLLVHTIKYDPCTRKWYRNNIIYDMENHRLAPCSNHNAKPNITAHFTEQPKNHTFTRRDGELIKQAVQVFVSSS